MQSISSSLAPRNLGCNHLRFSSRSSLVMVGKNCIASKNGPSCSMMRWIVVSPISIPVGKMILRLHVNPARYEIRSGSEIGNDHLPMQADLGRRAGRQHFSQVEHSYAITNIEYQVGMMLDQQHA